MEDDALASDDNGTPSKIQVTGSENRDGEGGHLSSEDIIGGKRSPAVTTSAIRVGSEWERKENNMAATDSMHDGKKWK